MRSVFTDAQLEAFLDELLPVAEMAAIENSARHSDALQLRLAEINDRRDAGVHSLGEIWRRRRLSCPTREQLGSYLLGVLQEDLFDFVSFHLKTIECRYCNASLEDLRNEQSAADAERTEGRRRRYFQSSAGYLRRGAEATTPRR